MEKDDSSQEKTEEATPRKLDKAREDGQIPRSKELTTSAILIGGTLSLMIFGPGMTKALQEVLRSNFALERKAIFDPNTLIAHLVSSFEVALISIMPIFLIVMVAAIVGPIALGGWLFSAKSLAPKLNRIDPLGGMKRMFSAKSLVELIKAIGKVLVVIASAYVVFLALKPTILGLAFEGVERGMAHSVELALWAAIVVSCSTIVIAAIDIPFQIYDNSKKLKMSKQEVKDEMKDTEGKPEVKGKIRQMQQQMSQSRMMQAVPDADVVITNPTHYSVALRYDPEKMDTPILVAKGVDFMAMKIREIAKANDIEFVEAPMLARAVYHTTEAEQPIPQGLYVAVAQVLAYIFQIREYRKGRAERPVLTKNLPIPEDMRY